MDSPLTQVDVLSSVTPTVIYGIAVACATVSIAYLIFGGRAEVKGKSTLELSGGGLEGKEVQKHWAQYDAYFQRKPGKSVANKQETPQFVDTYYNLVTDIYEWGWGQSFHFSPAIKGKSDREATRLHEEMVANLLELVPGQKVLDAGCGVGGPLRAIAHKSQAHITGITINDYQVKRAKEHNEKAGLSHLCEVVKGNFLQMPFEDNSFNAAYSIEATCHAPQLVDVYKEIYRVLKPGSLYVTYEWVKTKKFDPKNERHVRIIDEICYGDALPELRNYLEIVQAAKEAGFEVLDNRDLAAPPSLPWWRRLKMGRVAYIRNHIMVTIVSALGLAPKGLKEAHNMLVNVAVWLVLGGETGVFTPAHMLKLRKPLAK